MKTNLSVLASTLALVGGLGIAPAHAVTSPATVAEFLDTTPQTLTIHALGWSDPAFGDMGWTHRSAWGKFTAEKDQTVEIMVDSGNVSVHPGVSVWYRDPVKDTVDDKYVFDHFYAQMANQYKSKAVDEKDGTALGNLVMKNVAYGYDLDGKNNPRIVELRGIRDKVAGKLTLSFKAAKSGTYIFVVGGINAGDNLYDVATDGSKTLKVDEATTNYTKIPVETTVTVTTP
jgi:hypothetical protein